MRKTDERPPPGQRLDRIRAALMEGGRSSEMVDQHTYLNATGKVICTGGVFGLEERWRAGQASKAGRPECHQCWTDSLGLRFGDRMEFRYGCLASTWLMTDCHRPDRR